jgi:hypothetical protein
LHSDQRDARDAHMWPVSGGLARIAVVIAER